MSKLGFVRIPAQSARYDGSLKFVEKDFYLNLDLVFSIELCCDDLFDKGQDVTYIQIELDENAYEIHYCVFIGENDTIKTWLQSNTI